MVYSTYGRDDKLYRILVGAHEEERLLGRPRRRWDQKSKL
jgi:hypothetical protein